MLSKEYGVDAFNCQQVSTLLMTNDFINIHQQAIKVPIGWGRHQLGQAHSENFYAFLNSMHPVKIKEQLSSNDFKTMIKECTVNQSHMNWFVCYAQKPIPHNSNSLGEDDDSFIDDFLNEFTD